MRHGRAKQTRRTLQFFERSVDIRPPYNVLIDGTFLIAALKFKIPLEDRLSKLLQQSQFRLCFLSGTLNELHNIKSQSKESSLFGEAIRFLRNHCVRLEPSNDAPKTNTRSSKDLNGAAADIYRFVAKHNEQSGPPTYVVASQDEELLSSFREGVLVPLIRLAHNTVLLLERPSKQIQQHRLETERQVESVFEKTQEPSSNAAASADGTREGRKKGKAKGPNPLSCKKKKRKVDQQDDQKPDETEVKKRTRRRKRKEVDVVDSGSDKEE